ncbi:unnamed protein product [Schistosoma mattheei]|uniref:Uncharacterized protein n=1 Tax=Schistosoma mattheei TaxID=31246 RepID=A0A183PJW4_9TREM|nr:unnamed protein product [Schistosoma mattheei]
MRERHSNDNQRNRWVEHSEELLNRPASLNPLGTEAAHTDFPIAVTPPTIEELRIAVRQISSGKAAGPDNIPAEALNYQKTDERSRYASNHHTSSELFEKV